jgi:hypothetical protein
MISRNEVSVKTTLAPNAPWYKSPEPPKPPPKRTHRAKPSEIDKKFEEWLLTLEKITK